MPSSGAARSSAGHDESRHRPQRGRANHRSGLAPCTAVGMRAPGERGVAVEAGLMTSAGSMTVLVCSPRRPADGCVGVVCLDSSEPGWVHFGSGLPQCASYAR